MPDRETVAERCRADIKKREAGASPFADRVSGT